ncbi:hypothetical protein [Halobacterium litoreum]|uniref:Energy-coupling factor transport system substrate-specific component n=1 Tax=Halobacterium litoreum TaxID=2039234 RepID=A0ABD5NCH7_9EURY|nr:hypothetical protein [Halobacterium litoreum]UHH14134.1 hypothetical protein LT972_03830 [Halobacterium litoreum]
MNRTERLAPLIKDERTNAALGWLLVAFVALVAVESAPEDLVWVTFSAAVVVVVLVPPVAYRNAKAMLPWEVLLLVGLPVFGRAFTAPGLSSDVATYLAVAALALVVAVELDVFTPVSMTNWFAVLFVVITTMAAAGLWAIVQYASDLFLSTTFILPTEPPLTQAQEEAALNALMWDFVAATVAGIGAGLVFVLYFRRRASADLRLPEEVEEVVK